MNIGSYWRKTMSDVTRAFVVAIIGTFVAHYIYQALLAQTPNWSDAFERSYFGMVAIAAAWWNVRRELSK
jgi:hypothetical protein